MARGFKIQPMKVIFSDPDKYGEVHANIQLPLDIRRHNYIDLEINNRPSARYCIILKDAGTIGYAQMQGQCAVGGTLSNVSMNWAKDDPDENWGIIHAIGTIDNGDGNLHLFKKIDVVAANRQ